MSAIIGYFKLAKLLISLSMAGIVKQTAIWNCHSLSAEESVRVFSVGGGFCWFTSTELVGRNPVVADRIPEMKLDDSALRNSNIFFVILPHTGLRHTSLTRLSVLWNPKAWRWYDKFLYFLARKASERFLEVGARPCVFIQVYASFCYSFIDNHEYDSHF